MNCNCLREVRDTLMQHHRAKAGDDVSVECMNAATVLDPHSYSTIVTFWRVQGSKPGYRLGKGKEVVVQANFCPFCGKAITPPRQPDAEPECKPFHPPQPRS